MTKSGLEAVIANLKDRCKESLNINRCCVCPAGESGSTSCVCVPAAPIDSDQVVSLSALVSYVAKMTGRTEYRVERDLSDYFCIPNPKCLSLDLYEQAIKYMVDQVPEHFC